MYTEVRHSQEDPGSSVDHPSAAVRRSREISICGMSNFGRKVCSLSPTSLSNPLTRFPSRNWGAVVSLFHKLRRFCCDPRLLGDVLISEIMGDVVPEVSDDGAERFRLKEQDRAGALMGSKFMDLVNETFGEQDVDNIPEVRRNELLYGYTSNTRSSGECLSFMPRQPD